MPHTIDLDEMLTWIAESENAYVTYATSTSERKSLAVKIAGGYRVTVDGDTVYEGTDGKTAVEKYNAV